MTERMFKTLIIEDTQANQEIITGYLELLYPELQVGGCAIDVQPAVDLIDSERPDLLFMDIQLKTGTGFDVLDHMMGNGDNLPEIIFITAYGKYEYATKAFEYSAVDFVTKPIDPDKFQRAVDRALERIRNRQENRTQMSMMMDMVKNGANRMTRMAFHRVRGMLHFVEVDKVTHCQADGSITRVMQVGGESFTATRNLGHYSRVLLQDFNFFEISNNTIVNLDYLATYNHGELAITLTTGDVLFASRRGGQRLKDKLQA